MEEAVRALLDSERERRGPGRAARRVVRAWRRTLRRLFPLGHVSAGNRLRWTSDGDVAFESMWAGIDRARRRVRLATYTFEPDRVGREMLARLARAAERGVDVLLVVDAFGSHRLSRADVAELERAGGRFVRFNPLFGGRGRSRLVRLHQKILAIDEREAFVGGMNVSEEYAGERLGTARFRDSLLHVTGPAAGALDRLVERSLGEADARPAGVEESGQGGVLVQVLEANVRRHHRSIQRALRMMLGRAQRSCYLTNPYFVPPARLRRALCKAAERGVDVRLLTAGKSDVPLVRSASRHIYGRLLRAGVRVFELQGRMLHAKTTTTDGLLATVGSFNLDRWSDRRNLEVSVCVLDHGLADELEHDFARDQEAAREVRLEAQERRTVLQRLGHWAAYQLLRW